MSSVQPTPQFIRMDPLDESELSAMAHKEPTQYLRITKVALVQYMKECLGQNGIFHRFFSKFANSTADFHVNEDLDSDLNKAHLQIAAYWEGMTQRPPQIFVQDNGYTYLPDSLGSLNTGWNQLTKDGHQIIRITDVVRIPVDIICIALSEQEVEDLSSFLGVAFGQYQRLTVNYILKPEAAQNGVYWEVRLPFQSNISPKTHTPITAGEPRDQMWSFTCSMEIEFENSTYMQYRSQPLFVPQRGELTLTIPDTLRLGQEHRIILQNRPDPVSVYSDDNRVAVVRQLNREWIIIPRRIGTFNLIVSRTAGPQKGPEILTQQAIEIVSR